MGFSTEARRSASRARSIKKLLGAAAYNTYKSTGRFDQAALDRARGGRSPKSSGAQSSSPVKSSLRKVPYVDPTKQVQYGMTSPPHTIIDQDAILKQVRLAVGAHTYDRYDKGTSWDPESSLSKVRLATRIYQSVVAQRVDKGLRDNDLDPKDRKQVVEPLDSAMKPLKRPLTVYSGVVNLLDFHGVESPEELKDAVLTDAGYISATPVAAVAASFARGHSGSKPKGTPRVSAKRSAIIKVKLPKGQKAFFAGNAGENRYWREHEVILPRGTSLKVTDVHVGLVKTFENRGSDAVGEKETPFYIIEAEPV